MVSRYPDELAWQLDLDRKLIRQNDKLKRLHQFLIQETECVRVVAKLMLCTDLLLANVYNECLKKECHPDEAYALAIV